MNSTARLGPIHTPFIPYEYENTDNSVTGIPISQKARAVINAPNFYCCDALIAETATPEVVSKNTKMANIYHALIISSLTLLSSVKILMIASRAVSRAATYSRPKTMAKPILILK